MVEGDLPGLSKGKTESYVQRWEYETHFREYAFLLGSKGKDALESIDNYPNKIELNATWHTVLDKLRAETLEDKNERFSVIGFTNTSRDFYFPEIPITGEPYTIPVPLIRQTIRTAKEEHGVTSIVGDLHSHNYPGPLTFVDFHGMLDRRTSHQPFIRGLVNPGENIFAFRTIETYMVNDFGIPKYTSTEGFKEYWMRKAGFKPSPKPHHISRARPSADMWEANIAIAQAHRLALYKGKPNEDLVRIQTNESLGGSWSNLLQEVLQA